MAQMIGREAGEASPQTRVDAWLERFEAALVARDVEAASGMFAAEAACTLGSRGWSIEAIRASGEVFLPEGIVPLIERVLGESG